MRKRYELKREARAARAQGLKQGDESAIESTVKPTEKLDSGVIKRFSRIENAASAGTSLCMIKQTYPDAIEYTAIAKGMRGMVMLFGLGTAGLAFWFAYASARDLLVRDLFGSSTYFFLVVSFIFFLVGVYWTVKAIRLELFRPQDEPTIFDRKNRKVYRIYRETYAGWRGLFTPWPLKMAEHDWDLIDAEHHAAVFTTGSTVSRMHGLIFLVRKGPTDPTLVGSFAIGNGLQLGEVTVPAVWEHIRRFMEEGGPHLPPNETLQPFEPPSTFWPCMAAPFPSLSQVRAHWWEQFPMTLMGLIFSPIILPIMVVLGVFTWLAHLTSTPISWSPEVLQAIGARQETPATHSGERT